MHCLFRRAYDQRGDVWQPLLIISWELNPACTECRGHARTDIPSRHGLRHTCCHERWCCAAGGGVAAAAVHVTTAIDFDERESYTDIAITGMPDDVAKKLADNRICLQLAREVSLGVGSVMYQSIITFHNHAAS